MGFFYNGGGERTVLSEAAELARRGHEVDVYAPTRSRDCFPELLGRVSFAESAGFLPQGLPLRNALGMLYVSLTAWASAKRLADYDALLAHGQPGSWLAHHANKTLGVGYVCYLHQANRFLYPRSIDRETGWGVSGDMVAIDAFTRGFGLIKRLDQASVRGCGALLVNSDWIRKQVQECYGVDATVCHPGVDPEEFKPGGMNGGYVLSTNRHFPQKRLDYVLRVLKEIEDVRGVITGAETGYTARLRSLAGRLGLGGRVEFTGSVPAARLIELYRGAAVYSYPSPEEDFGLGPVEAGACGVPSVVWDNAGPREVVEQGVTGFRAAPGDLRGFVESHRLLLTDRRLRSRMGESARRRVEKKFTWRRHVDVLEKRLEEVSG